tara:strand:- start:75 stop:464 length:390 start_codon:yes stop_codon:yes gene_type:complete
MKKITLILIALITVGCSDPKDKYISLECEDSRDLFNLILNKETMTFDTYSSIYGERYQRFPRDSFVGKFEEFGENYYRLFADGSTDPELLDRRTLLMMPAIDMTEYGVQCKKVDLPEHLNSEGDLKNQI